MPTSVGCPQAPSTIPSTAAVLTPGDAPGSAATVVTREPVLSLDVLVLAPSQVVGDGQVAVVVLDLVARAGLVPDDVRRHVLVGIVVPHRVVGGVGAAEERGREHHDAALGEVGGGRGVVTRHLVALDHGVVHAGQGDAVSREGGVTLGRRAGLVVVPDGVVLDRVVPGRRVPRGSLPAGVEGQDAGAVVGRVVALGRQVGAVAHEHTDAVVVGLVVLQHTVGVGGVTHVQAGLVAVRRPVVLEGLVLGGERRDAVLRVVVGPGAADPQVLGVEGDDAVGERGDPEVGDLHVLHRVVEVGGGGGQVVLGDHAEALCRARVVART